MEISVLNEKQFNCLPDFKKSAFATDFALCLGLLTNEAIDTFRFIRDEEIISNPEISEEIKKEILNISKKLMSLNIAIDSAEIDYLWQKRNSLIPNFLKLQSHGNYFYLNTNNDRLLLQREIPGLIKYDINTQTRHHLGIRPTINFDNETIFQSIKKINDEEYIGYYGEYPQYAPNIEHQQILENLYRHNKLTPTGKAYTTDTFAANKKDNEKNL